MTGQTLFKVEYRGRTLSIVEEGMVYYTVEGTGEWINKSECIHLEELDSIGSVVEVLVREKELLVKMKESNIAYKLLGDKVNEEISSKDIKKYLESLDYGSVTEAMLVELEKKYLISK